MGRKDDDLVDQEEVEAQVVINGNGDDDDDAEANEDLTLKIVEKAILLKKKEAKIDNNAAVNVETTLKDGEKVTDGPSQKKVKKVIKKVVKKVVKKVKVKEEVKKELPVETAEIDLVTNGKHNGFNTFCSDLFTDEEVKQVEKIVGAEDAADAAEIIDNVQTSPDDNHVLQKLLRGPRYFDPPQNGWGACYNCGEDGHTTVNCTSARRKKPCFVCGSLEHNAKECSKGQSCYICKKPGHRAKDCSEKSEGYQNSKFCLKCGENGHDMLSCRSNYCPDDLKEIQCYVCGESGHLCCKNYPDTGPREVSCYKCGFPGHTGLACKRSHGETTPGSGSISSCFKCGEEGHFARECSNSKAVKWSNHVRRDNSEVTPGSPNSFGKGRKKRKINYETSSKSPKYKHGWTSEHPGDYHNSNGRSGGWVPPTPPPPVPYNNGDRWGSPVTPSYYSNGGVGGRWGTPSSYNNNSGVGGRWGSPAAITTPSYSNGIGGRWDSPATIPYNNNNYAASGHASSSYPSRYHHGTSKLSNSSSNGYRHGHSGSSQYGSNHHHHRHHSGGVGKHYRWE